MHTIEQWARNRPSLRLERHSGTFILMARQTSPSVSLVEYLSSLSQMNGNRLTVNIFLYNWEPERVPSRLPIILPIRVIFRMGGRPWGTRPLVAF